VTGIVAQPTLEESLVARRGTFTVPDALATVNCDCALRKPCRGLALINLSFEHHALEIVARSRAKEMFEKLALRGQELKSDLMLHGPWVSQGYEDNLVDVGSSLWSRAEQEGDPRLILPFVYERDPNSGQSDYLLVGNFLIRNVFIEGED
jgi:hypothetical protein